MTRFATRTFAASLILAAASLVACVEESIDDPREEAYAPAPTDPMAEDPTADPDPADPVSMDPDPVDPDPVDPDPVDPDPVDPDPDPVDPDPVDPDPVDPDPVDPTQCTADADCASGEVCESGACEAYDCMAACECFALPGVCSCMVPSIRTDEYICAGNPPDPAEAGTCDEPSVVYFDAGHPVATAQWRGDTTGAAPVEYSCDGFEDPGVGVIYELATGQFGSTGTLTLSVRSDSDHWIAVEYGYGDCTFHPAYATCTNQVGGPGIEVIEIPLWTIEGESLRVQIGAHTADAGPFDVEGQFVAAECGNQIAEPGERCDGGATGATTCESLNYRGGTLGCMASCGEFDESACEEWIRNETEPNVGTAYANDFVNPYIGSAAGGDSDWMRFEVTEATTVSAYAHPTNGAQSFTDNFQTDVSVGFANADGQFMEGATYGHSMFLQPGTYYVILDVWGPANAFGYRLELQGL